MGTTKSRFDQWIFDSFSVTAEGLGMLRIFSSLFILFFLIPGYGTGHFEFLSTVPDDFYAPPPGPLVLFDGFPPLAFFQVFHTVLIVSLLAMLFGYRTKWASVLAGVSMLVLQGFMYSIGKVNHEILIPLVPIIMAFSNWGAAFSVDAMRSEKKAATESWPLTLLAVFIAFMMFTAGLPKILGGWLDPSTQATQGHLLNQFFIRERQALLAGWAAGFDQPFFWELLDWATILFEIGFVVAVLRAAWFRFFVGVAVLFHFSTMMTLNIAFLPNFLAYAVFLNWDKIYLGFLERYRKWTGIHGEKSKIRTVIFFTGTLFLIFFTLWWVSGRGLVSINSDLLLHEIVLVSSALVIVLMSTVMKLFVLMRTEKSSFSMNRTEVKAKK